MVRQVGVYEAKSKLSQLVEEVEHGQSIVITRHGRPVAKIVPVEEERPDVEETIAAIRAFREKHPLNGITIKELINEGRRI